MMAHVECGDSDRISGGYQSGGRSGGIEEDEGEHSVEQVTKTGTIFFILYRQALS